MTRPWIALIESNTSGTGRLFARAAAEDGYQPVLLAEQPQRYGFPEQDCVPCVRCCTGSIASVCEALDQLAREAPLAGIFSSSEYFIETAASCAARYGLSAADPAMLRACRNKWTQRQYLQRHGLLVPRFECVASPQAAGEALARIPLPVILKPTTGSGSVGVKLCRTAGEVAEHTALLLGRGVNERGIPVPAEMLIEEYLVGPEYSVEMFGDSVVGITRKHVSREPYFVELGHDFPACLPPETEESIAEAAAQALQSLGLNWGPAHVELRVTLKGPAIVEINPRLAGGFIPEILRLAFGVDVIRETIRLVVGGTPDLRARRNSHASIRFLVPSGDGTITGTQGIAEARKVPGVVDIQMYRKTGDRVKIENDFRDRIGHVISLAEQEKEAVQSAEAALRKIKIQVGAG